MFTRFELKLIHTLRGAFSFFLICMLFAAAITYAIHHDVPTALVFGACGVAQMALAIVFPGRVICPYQMTNDRSIVDPGASCATDFPLDRAKGPDSTKKPPGLS